MRCAACEAEIAPGRGREVDIEHGSSASPTLTIHDDPADCAPTVPVRRTPRPASH
jgi:hypothetical protein